MLLFLFEKRKKKEGISNLTPSLYRGGLISGNNSIEFHRKDYLLVRRVVALLSWIDRIYGIARNFASSWSKPISTLLSWPQQQQQLSSWAFYPSAPWRTLKHHPASKTNFSFFPPFFFFTSFTWLVDIKLPIEALRGPSEKKEEPPLSA